MIALFLTLAIAQEKYPASVACHAMAAYFQKEHISLIEKNRKTEEDCEKAKKKLPRDLQNKIICIKTFTNDDWYLSINTFRFINECSKILMTNPMIKEELYKPFRAEDYQVKPVKPSWVE